MGTDPQDELLNVRASGAAIARIFYRDLVTIVLLSLAWALAALPLITLGSATLALTETITRVITDRSENRLLGERERLQLFRESFRRNLRLGLPVSLLSGGLLFGLWLHTQAYAVSGRWLFSASTVVGLYLLVVGTTWIFRAASLLVRMPADNQLGPVQALVDGAELAIQYPHYTGLQLLTVGGLLMLLSIKPVALPLLFPGTVATVEVIAFEEMVNRGAADIRQYYAEVP